ncbi:YraN family protein [Alphaproteobacteria bacterium LSUCC0719]|jgi:putative endonuclease
MTSRQQSERHGRTAEALAMMYFRLTGHHILARRWRGHAGEIDLVARRWKVVIFCEVKFRRQAEDGGLPSPQQRRRICRAAEEFMSRHHLSDKIGWRFDLVQISPPFRGNILPVRHLRDAWRCDGRSGP